MKHCISAVFFFFQAEDGIRDGHVTGVQTCALPISRRRPRRIRCSSSDFCWSCWARAWFSISDRSRNSAESAPRAVASVTPSLRRLIRPRSLPLAVLINNDQIIGGSNVYTEKIDRIEICATTVSIDLREVFVLAGGESRARSHASRRGDEQTIGQAPHLHPVGRIVRSFDGYGRRSGRSQNTNSRPGEHSARGPAIFSVLERGV